MEKQGKLGEPVLGITSKPVASEIADRLSQELIFALVGPIGSGVSVAATELEATLSQKFGYDVGPILKPSDIIRAEAYRVGIIVPPRTPLNKYIEVMQTAGNDLREKFGTIYLAEKMIEKIVQFRTKQKGYKEVRGNRISLPGRRAYIIDSIKNLDELELLRQTYGEMLCVVGVFAPDGIRESRLGEDGMSLTEIKTVVSRDQGEVVTFGQKTRKVFVQADFFLCNDGKLEAVRTSIERYLNLIFRTKIHTPTLAESSMYKASAAALSSGCMSLQVGAAIASESGELISVGWNDVPKFNGGLYSEEDQTIWPGDKTSMTDGDKRCFNSNGKICHNETRRKKIISDIANKIFTSKILKKTVTTKGVSKSIKYSDVLDILTGTAVDSLIEFSRSIHAEMEAILSVAREGRHSLVGSTLYTTTYPCHNCARHIVASGIRTVIYIEPYSKSLAIALHSDSITEDPEDATKVIFRQYHGVAPQKFLKLFLSNDGRKVDGKLSKHSPKEAVPMFRIPLDAPDDYEAKIIADLSEKEHDDVDATV